jgi:hypothetical protein
MDTARNQEATRSVPAPPAPAAPAPTYYAQSPHFTLDRTIPIELRGGLISVLYALAFEETIANNESYRTFGTTPVSVATSYDELTYYTGYNATRLAKLIRSAENQGLLKLTGSARTGFRFHILHALRIYTKREGENARPIFAWNREVKKNRRQLALGEIPAKEQHAPKAATSSRSRAPEAYDALLGLARTKDARIQTGNMIFEAAVDEILTAVETRFPGQVATIVTRIIADPRIERAGHPIDYIRQGIKQGYLFKPEALPKPAPQTPAGAFDALPPGLQTTLLEAIRAQGNVTSAWCRERDIPPGAAAHARFLIQAKQQQQKLSEVNLTGRFFYLPDDLRQAIIAAHQRNTFSPLLFHLLENAKVLADNSDEIRLGLAASPETTFLLPRLLQTTKAMLPRAITFEIFEIAEP